MSMTNYTFSDMQLSDLEWCRLYLFTCRIIASQFPVPTASVPGLFLRAFIDWLGEQLGSRLHMLPAGSPVAASAQLNSHLSVWMHPHRLERLAAGRQNHFGLLTLARGSEAVPVSITAYEAAQPNELWVTAVGWTNIQAALQVQGTLHLHRFSVGRLPPDREPEAALEAAVSVIWRHDIAGLSADQRAAIIKKFFVVPRLFIDNAYAAVDIKACLSFECLAVYNCNAKYLYIRVKRTDIGNPAKTTGFLIDKNVTRLVQDVLKNMPLPGCPMAKPCHSPTLWKEILEIVETCSKQVRTE
jgi:hypothetical protein